MNDAEDENGYRRVGDLAPDLRPARHRALELAAGRSCVPDEESSTGEKHVADSVDARCDQERPQESLWQQHVRELVHTVRLKTGTPGLRSRSGSTALRERACARRRREAAAPPDCRQPPIPG